MEEKISRVILHSKNGSLLGLKSSVSIDSIKKYLKCNQFPEIKDIEVDSLENVLSKKDVYNEIEKQIYAHAIDEWKKEYKNGTIKPEDEEILSCVLDCYSNPWSWE